MTTANAAPGLTSGILATGMKFKVTEDSVDGTFGPGSTGFIAYVVGKDRDFPNVFYMKAVIIRRGKTGMPRIDINELSCPVFDFGAKNALFHKIMPDEKRKYYLHIEPEPFEENLMEMDALDFIGWAAAYAQFLNKLSTRAKHFNPWPQQGDNVLNELYSIRDYWQEGADACYDRFANTDARANIVATIRMMESSLVKCALSYIHRVSEVETMAAQSLLEKWSSDFKLTTKKALRDNYQAYQKKMKSVELLKKKPGKKVSGLTGFSFGT